MKTFTNNDLEKYNKEVEIDKIYGEEFKIIEKVIKDYPYNNDRTIIALKIALIDITNSTNINKYKSFITLNELVNVIYNIKDFDKKLSEGKHDLIEKIAKSNGKINLFSFATKYCCYHNTIFYKRDDYSIYDSVLKEHLPEYVENLSKNRVEQWRINKDYESYHNCITEILERNKITLKNKRRKFDRYIWWLYRRNEN